ncbi:hypothetical protein M409DRAFT_69979 [Zasmidium cellare ATCC 36951]|uniref:tripeptidyl-peptidase II n=1 Tax=Zasmidium cellare ATCC 36951 TaxID=1080233 RepID=A0A6A6C5W1_ZASCE|nr:uncharacterized protein M409DRAFT_69979 [Zasmidium cellare ATCC 36951]KAF2161129.1 hypothetical protein M409DRAFT_69979 [Zasmidium cellare ATCC 36951]
MPFLFSLVTALAATAVAVPSTRPAHEKRDALSSSWKLARRAPVEQVVPVRVGMKQRNLDEGARILHELSNQDSPKYGQWWSVEDIHDFFAPATKHVESVKDWLSTSGIHYNRTSLSANKQWVQFDATIAELEDLLHTEYHVYEHQAGHTMPSCDEYYVPSQLRNVIDYITPGVNLGQPSDLTKRDATPRKGFKLPLKTKPLPSFKPEASNDLGLCSSVVTPACIKAMYNITNGTRAATGNELGIFEDLGDHYSQEDLNTFFKAVYPQIPQGTHPTLQAIDGATGPVPVSQAGGESDLDFQISYPIIWPQNSVLFQTDDDNYENDYEFEGFLNTFLDAIDGSYCSYSAYGEKSPSPLDPQYPDPASGGYKGQLQCGVYKPTNVISISYGGSELFLSTNYQRRQCDEYMKLGLQGVSVVISSGDDGVSCDSYQSSIFSPGFPVTCPYVTAVGSTAIPPGGAVTADQIATTEFSSGGGFSNVFPTPDYQKTAVNTYLTNHPPSFGDYQTKYNESVGANNGVYNSAGRAYPDLSAIGQDVLTYTAGRARLTDGTSASAPVIGSILTRINEERIAKGKPTVGFINPTVYAHPEVFRDVVTGSNPGQGSLFSPCDTPGFNAAPGWDPVTGLGVPDYAKLLKLWG